MLGSILLVSQQEEGRKGSTISLTDSVVQTRALTYMPGAKVALFGKPLLPLFHTVAIGARAYLQVSRKPAEAPAGRPAMQRRQPYFGKAL